MPTAKEANARFDELFKEYMGFVDKIFDRSPMWPVLAGPLRFKHAITSREQRQILDELKKLLPRKVAHTDDVSLLFEYYKLGFRFKDDELTEKIFTKLKLNMKKRARRATPEEKELLLSIARGMQMLYSRNDLWSCI